MKKYHFETQSIKSVQTHFEKVNPVASPIYLSTTFVRNPDGSYNDDFVYSRADNPNRRTLEKSLAQLEDGHSAYAFSSGMAAVTAIFQSLSAGDHILLPDDIYFNVYLLAEEVFSRWNLEFSLVDMTDLSMVEKMCKKNTRLIWVESPSNPQLKITDIAALAKIAKKQDAILVVDNTWPTPVTQKPLYLGADVVMHSTTKYFGGHSDVLGGCIIVKEENNFTKRLERIQALVGGVPSPFDCWLISRGIQTLYIRVKTQSESARQLANYLNRHPKIEKVNYPGLPDHTNHEVAARQMTNGYGAMLSVLVKGGRKEAIAVSNRLELFTTATSLGGVESLVEHRKSVEGESSKTPENLLRISVGLENIDDLINDWAEALK